MRHIELTSGRGLVGLCQEQRQLRFFKLVRVLDVEKVDQHAAAGIAARIVLGGVDQAVLLLAQRIFDIGAAFRARERRTGHAFDGVVDTGHGFMPSTALNLAPSAAVRTKRPDLAARVSLVSLMAYLITRRTRAAKFFVRRNASRAAEYQFPAAHEGLRRHVGAPQRSPC